MTIKQRNVRQTPVQYINETVNAVLGLVELNNKVS